ncbi:1025_t:CDS:2 [Diversispora eburnea]|uniref:1025_t:CDS:1 n=1 Tax=Diversispora eburnea TaxID=1213867 RepID=A0A9N8YQT7_9GLOM|nr:1025_t:CDS:2 [Diversispora eburnea]
MSVNNNNPADRLSTGMRRDWRSGYTPIDELLQEMRLEFPNPAQHLNWIPFEEFVNCIFTAKGGFSTIYEATWSTSGKTVSLKSLNNSQNLSIEYLNELKKNWILFLQPQFLRCYGITQQPTTGEFMMVMQYAPCGDLRSLRNNNTLRKRPPIPINTPSFYSNLMISCWDPNPSKRPDFENISKIIYHWLVDDSLEASLRKGSSKSALKSSSKKQHPDAVYFSRILDFPEIKESRRRQYHSLNIPRSETSTSNQLLFAPLQNSHTLRNSYNNPPTFRDANTFSTNTKFSPPKDTYSFLSQPPPPPPGIQSERSLNNPRGIQNVISIFIPDDDIKTLQTFWATEGRNMSRKSLSNLI